jgi:hypothetical protein
MLADSNDLLLAGGIDEAVFDAIAMLSSAGASTFEQLCTEVSSDHLDPKLGHPAGEDSVAAGNLEHRFAGLQVEQPFARWTNEDALEVVTVTHIIVPECGVLIPNTARFFIQIN